MCEDVKIECMSSLLSQGLKCSTCIQRLSSLFKVRDKLHNEWEVSFVIDLFAIVVLTVGDA